MNNMKNRYHAGVIGIRECGHAHRSIKAAVACGDKHYDAHYGATGSWNANADWHNFKIIDQSGDKLEVDLSDYR